MSVAAVEVCFGKLGIGLDDFIVFDNRFFDLATVVQLEGGLERIFRLARASGLAVDR